MNVVVMTVIRLSRSFSIVLEAIIPGMPQPVPIRIGINDFPEIIFNPFSSLIDCIALIKYASLVISTDTCFVHAANFFNSKMYPRQR